MIEPVRIGDATLYLGDCLDILPTLGPVDAVVTDPPYGIGWSRATWEDDADQYPSLMSWLVEQTNRVVPKGFVFIFQAMPNVGRFAEWFPKGFRIFAACKNFAQIRPTGVWHSWDPVVFWRNGPNGGPNSGIVNRDFFVGNVAGLFGEKAEHPTPKPLDTMMHIVGLAAPSRGSVLDPFMGSGTTGVACARLGRKFIGIEIEPKYFDIACKRISREYEQLKLFPPEEKREAVQMELEP
jgi:site-specific DNA-methyltransferase (adenine-specific)